MALAALGLLGGRISTCLDSMPSFNSTANSTVVGGEYDRGGRAFRAVEGPETVFYSLLYFVTATFLPLYGTEAIIKANALELLTFFVVVVSVLVRNVYSLFVEGTPEHLLLLE